MICLNKAGLEFKLVNCEQDGFCPGVGGKQNEFIGGRVGSGFVCQREGSISCWFKEEHGLVWWRLV